MSIILKGMCNFENSGGGGTVDPPTPPKPEDIAPNTVSNVSFTDKGKGSITVKWSDPNDTILEGVTIAKWYRTVLVYKKGSAPTSITDGQTVNNYYKNQYLYNGYPLTIDPDVTYYFKFFTVSDKNKTNTSDRSYTFKSAGSKIDPVFRNNSWETIVEVAKQGKAQDYWQIGDTKPINDSNPGRTLQIQAFNHYYKPDGSKANLCLSESTPKYTGRCPDDANMITVFAEQLKSEFPSVLSNNIEKVCILYNKDMKKVSPNGDGTIESQQMIAEIFIPGATEVAGEGGGADYGISYLYHQTQFASLFWFTRSDDYWTRDCRYGQTSGHLHVHYYMKAGGTLNGQYGSTKSYYHILNI